MNSKTTDIIIRLQGLLELSVLLFLLGILLNISILVIVGGILMVISDLLGILSGALHPLSPVLLAIVLSFIINPWYLGVFWSVAVFGILDIPNAFKKVINGSKGIDMPIDVTDLDRTADSLRSRNRNK